MSARRPRTAPATRRWAKVAGPVAALALVAGGAGVAQAVSQPASVHTAVAKPSGLGQMQFGKTVGFYKSQTRTFTYTHGFYCDTTVAATSTSGCEAGVKANKPPEANFDPLFVLVPLGFAVPAMKMDCPTNLVCVDHPDKLDMTRLAPALAPIFKTTPEKLLPALQNFATPGHDHIVTDDNNNRPEWWDVRVIGVTSKATYDAIKSHGSYDYVQKLRKAGNETLTADIPTNLFLSFTVEKH